MRLNWTSRLDNMGCIVRTSLIVVAIIPLLIYLLTSNYFITRNFWNLEEANIREQVGHALKGIDGEAAELANFAKDYAVWNEFYDKLNGKDIAWFRENVTNWLPQNQEVDLVIVANKDKQVIDEFGLVPGSEKEILENDTIKGILTQNYDKPQFYPGGLKLYGGELYIIAASPVLKSYYKGKPAGVLILGRKVTSKVILNIKHGYGHDVFFYHSGKLVASQEDMLKAKEYLNRFNQFRGKDVIQIGNTRILGSNILRDISGKTVGRLFVINNRDMFFSTLALVHRNGYAVLALSLGIIIFLSIRMKNFIVSPIKDLELQISQMASGGFLGSVQVQGPQEIQRLAGAFNSLSASLKAHKEENLGLKNITITDDLTSLYNHRYFHEYLKTRFSSNTKQVTLLIGDLDFFKVVNDVHGHIAGDLILRETARIITSTVGEGDKVFRYGGEEFAVLVDDNNPQQVFETAEKIRIAVASCPVIQQYSGYFPVTISIGIAFYPNDAKNVEGIVDKADKAMYFAKKSGRNQCKFYSAYMDTMSGEDPADVTKQEMLIDSTYSLAAAIDAKDSYTEKHSEMVTRFALMLAEKMNLSEQDRYMLRIGGLLHDVGKIGVPDEIIHKSGQLTEEDWLVVRNHTLIGSNIAKHIIKSPEIDSCIRYHHERWDGTGYPEGLAGETIPYLARIICIADSYHAMISDRPYRQALSREAAFTELCNNKGTQFDPWLVDKFLEAINELDTEKAFNS